MNRFRKIGVSQTYSSLRFKIIILLITSAVLVMLLTACYLYFYQQNQLETERRRTSDDIADRLAFTMQQPLWSFDRQSLEALLEQELKNDQVQAVLLETPDGLMKIGRKKDSLRGAVIAVDPKDVRASSNVIETVRSIVKEGTTIGTVRIVSSDWLIRQKLATLVLQQAIQSLAVLAGIIVLAYLGLSRLLLHPLKQLHQTAECYGQGDLTARSDISSGDEVGQLGATLNRMAEQLTVMINERTMVEEQLREQNEELTTIEEELRHQLDETLAAQSRLQISEDNYRCLVEDANSIILRMNPSGTITFFNEYAEKLFGFPREEITGKNIIGTIVPETETGGRDLVDLMQAILSHPEDYRLSENENIRKNGEKIWVRWANRPYYNENGMVSEILCVGQDVSEHRLLEQQVLQQQKLESVGLLAGGIAHDFNNLLSPIFIYTEMVRKKLNPSDQSFSRLGTVIEAAGKAKDLVKQLLSFSRKQLLSSQLHDLNDITGEFATMLRRTIRENIKLEVHLSSEPCPIMADKTQIEQILLNLAVNAQDAISGNGCITIETGHLILDNEYCNIHLGAIPGRYVLLSFGDTGCGMDDATLNHIFEPFFTTKAPGQGTGLGLSTVYGIVKQHGGHISIQSRPGVGTTFKVCLPESMFDAVSLPETAADEVERHDIRGTILLVEDNDMVREMTADLLKSHDFDVLSAGHPQEALELFNEQRDKITLLLTDVVMPQMTGPELYHLLIEQMPGLKALFMSGYANNITVHNGALEEEVNFIAKPFTSEILLKRIREIMTFDQRETAA